MSLILKGIDMPEANEIRMIAITSNGETFFNTVKAGTLDKTEISQAIQIPKGHGRLIFDVWNERTGNIVGGHQRVQVLKEIGETEIEVSVVNLSLKDEKQLGLALNKIKGKWDYEKLADVFRSLEGADLTATGFSADEIAILLEEDDIGEINWDDDWGFEPINENWVVILKFENYDKANEWAEAHGYEGQCRKGTKTTVIRVDNE